MPCEHSVGFSPRCCCVSALMVLPAAAWAQSTGSIAGVVRDTTGAVLPGVTVEAASPALIEKVRTVVTDDQGNYKIVDLRPGTYTVTFTLPGFSTVKREGIELTTGFTATVNAEMSGRRARGDGHRDRREPGRRRPERPHAERARRARCSTRCRPARRCTASPRSPSGRRSAAPAAGRTSAATRATATASSPSTAAAATRRPHAVRRHDVQQSGRRRRRTEQQYFVNQVAVAGDRRSRRAASAAEAETGGVQLNVVPKDGGNTFTVYFNADFTQRQRCRRQPERRRCRARGARRAHRSQEDLRLRRRRRRPDQAGQAVVLHGAPVVGQRRSTRRAATSTRRRARRSTRPISSRPAFTDFYQKDHSAPR